jgi:hypothetical protein
MVHKNKTLNKIRKNVQRKSRDVEDFNFLDNHTCTQSCRVAPKTTLSGHISSSINEKSSKKVTRKIVKKVTRKIVKKVSVSMFYRGPSKVFYSGLHKTRHSSSNSEYKTVDPSKVVKISLAKTKEIPSTEEVIRTMNKKLLIKQK